MGPKLYPCIVSSHAALDTIKALMARNPRIRPGYVSKIVIKTSKVSRVHAGWMYKPYDVVTAQMNLPYAISALLTDGELFTEQYSEERIFDSKIIELSNKVQIEEDPGIEALGAEMRHAVRVEIHLIDGTVERGESAHRRGSSDNPASEDEYIGKFERLVTIPGHESEAKELLNAILNLERFREAAEFTSLLEFKSKQTA